ncbi:Uncharacterised protein [Mycobacteroides abscessus subsp. abscessus]|nr:Uncharacterised protein [Mycobacteroides abscessus subsp. abscessus]
MGESSRRSGSAGRSSTALRVDFASTPATPFCHRAKSR